MATFFNLLIAFVIIIAVILLAPYVIAIGKEIIDLLGGFVCACIVGGLLCGFALWIVSWLFLNTTHYWGMHAFWVGAIVGAALAAVLVLGAAVIKK